MTCFFDLECKGGLESIQYKSRVTATSLHIISLSLLCLFHFLYVMFPYSWIASVPHLSSSLSLPHCLCSYLSSFLSPLVPLSFLPPSHSLSLFFYVSLLCKLISLSLSLSPSLCLCLLCFFIVIFPLCVSSLLSIYEFFSLFTHVCTC